MNLKKTIKKNGTKKLKGINILSLDEACKAAEDGKISRRSLVISIVSPKQENPSLLEIKRHQLNLRFCNTEDEYGMNRVQAQLLASFIQKNGITSRPVIIHCESGVSRSAGVAAAIKRFYGQDDMPIFRDKRYNPNMRCFKLLCEAFKISINDEEMAQRTQLSSVNFCNSVI